MLLFEHIHDIKIQVLRAVIEENPEYTVKALEC